MPGRVGDRLEAVACVRAVPAVGDCESGTGEVRKCQWRMGGGGEGMG